MKKDSIWIGGACIVLGIFIAFQMKFVQGTYLQGATPTQKSSEIINELNSVKAEKDALLEEIDTLEKQLETIQGSASEENAVVANLNNELNKYKLFAGMTKVQGPGLLITIDNPPTDDSFASDVNINTDYSIFLQILNELNSAGAEAISINEQRIVNTTEVRLAGSHINVNTIPLSSPFIIKVIGNSTTLEGAINQRFGVVSSIRDKGYYVEVKEIDNLELPAYNGSVNFKYSTIVK